MYGRPDRYGSPASFDLEAFGDAIGEEVSEEFGFVLLSTLAGAALSGALADRASGGKISRAMKGAAQGASEAKTGKTVGSTLGNIFRKGARGAKAGWEDEEDAAPSKSKSKTPVKKGRKPLGEMDELSAIEASLEDEPDELAAIEASLGTDELSALESEIERMGAVTWKMRFQDPTQMWRHDYASSSRSERIAEQVAFDADPDLPTPIDQMAEDAVEEGVREFFGAMPWGRRW